MTFVKNSISQNKDFVEGFNQGIYQEQKRIIKIIKVKCPHLEMRSSMNNPNLLRLDDYLIKQIRGEK